MPVNSIPVSFKFRRDNTTVNPQQLAHAQPSARQNPFQRSSQPPLTLQQQQLKQHQLMQQ
eukprot:Awhi_evm1s15512